MHRMSNIPNDDMRYVLSTFVVVPRRWVDEYGWRKMTDAEVLASVLYCQSLGRHMGIREIPPPTTSSPRTWTSTSARASPSTKAVAASRTPRWT
jgi:hypothetical protein